MKIAKFRTLWDVQSVLLLVLFTGATVAAQGTRAVWTKTDADPYTNVAFSHSGEILALGRQDTNTNDFLNAGDGSLIRSFSGNHAGVNALVFTPDDQTLI